MTEPAPNPLATLEWYLYGLRSWGLSHYPRVRSGNTAVPQVSLRQPAPNFAPPSPATTVTVPPSSPTTSVASLPAEPFTWEPDPSDDPAEGLRALHQELGDCRRCGLASTRTKLVFGTGSPSAALVLVGEAPGREEDLKGEPFVGRAGRLLDEMLGAIGLARNEVYITNILKCRPPDNRDPAPPEVSACAPYLRRQLPLLKPRVLLTLGRFAAQTLLGTSAPITRIRGKIFWVGPTILVPTFHPAYLLRNPKMKGLVWKDLLLVAALLRGEPAQQ
ncbi:MAG: hypothetical protein A2284_08185 [Deltaproteobacteria bacterium RIFOXYA12_FULL_61_11]|nr:MAG: hypothetical protein A2284_08185 [Deltaproteobacteria bacterium RIFOXYA12_FULL_61_11]